MQKLCLSTKFPQEVISLNYGIFYIENNSEQVSLRMYYLLVDTGH